jgi:hypothetical protein
LPPVWSQRMMLRPTTAITKAPPISATGSLEALGPLS